MNILSALVMGMAGFLPLAEYHWLCGGEFSLLLGTLFLAGGWGLALLGDTLRSRRAYWLILSAGLLLPWAVRAAVFLVTLPSGGNGSFAYILFDTDFSLILPLYYPLFLFFWLSLDRPGAAPMLLSILMLISGAGLLFYREWDTGREAFVRTLAGAGFSLFTGIYYLVLFRQRILFHRRSLLRRREGNLAVLFLFLPALLLLLRSYEEKSLAEGGGLLRNDLFQFDFSDVLTLQPNIAMSDELVMLFRKEGEAEKLLIRRHVLDLYDRERGFYREGEEVFIPPGGLKLEDPGYENRIEVLQEYYLINMNPSVSLGLNYPVEIEAFRKWEGSSFQKVLRTRSLVENTIRRNLAGIEEIALPEGEPCLDYGGREDIAELALSITENTAGPYRKARAVERYLKTNYAYSLNPGVSLYGDQLGYFLFVSKKGYCSYFAFAMTLMMRSLDIPARVAVGFWVDPDSEVLNFYPVTANQAHAWVEVYFNDKGWIEFDPTSEIMAEGEEFRFGSVDFELYNSLIEEIIHHDEELVPEENLSFREAVESSLRKSSRFLRKYFVHILISLLSGYILWVILLRRTPVAGPGASPAGKAAAAYVVRIKQLHRAGFPGRPGETPWEYALRVEKETALPVGELTRLYLKAEYSPRFDGDDWNSFEAQLEDYSLKWKNLPLLRRVLSLLYPLPQIRRYI